MFWMLESKGCMGYFGEGGCLLVVGAEGVVSGSWVVAGSGLVALKRWLGNNSSVGRSCWLASVLLPSGAVRGALGGVGGVGGG